ncbi:MAG: GDSL-type esterase/lipase family protein [Nodosilinea sp.]
MPEVSPPPLCNPSFSPGSVDAAVGTADCPGASSLSPGALSPGSSLPLSSIGNLSAHSSPWSSRGELEFQSLMATSSPLQNSQAFFPDQGLVRPSWANAPRPANGNQMYRFRLASLRAGKLYTRVSPQRYQHDWQGAPVHPTHQDWQALLRQEAAVMARAQGHNRLSIVLGDSLSLWLPSEILPRDHFWLNQGIAGETTTQILERLHDFAQTRPHTIHLMAGINDLKQGASDSQVLSNFQGILEHLKRQHPQARIVVYSILPTRWESLPGDRISYLNRSLSYLASYEGASFVDLQPRFRDGQGQLRRELTTDGMHLAAQGYELWRTALVSY